MPILLWGDLVKHGRPILRSAVAGYRAHQAMYAWVYLGEFLALSKLRETLVRNLY